MMNGIRWQAFGKYLNHESGALCAMPRKTLEKAEKFIHQPVHHFVYRVTGLKVSFLLSLPQPTITTASPRGQLGGVM